MDLTRKNLVTTLHEIVDTLFTGGNSSVEDYMNSDGRHRLKRNIDTFLNKDEIIYEDRFRMLDLSSLFEKLLKNTSQLDDKGLVTEQLGLVQGAFRLLEKCTITLLLKPYRKDFYIIEMYNGLMQNEICTVLSNVKVVFLRMGYREYDAGTLKLENKPDRSLLESILLDLLVCQRETKQLLTLYENIAHLGYSIDQVFQARLCCTGDIGSCYKWMTTNMKPRYLNDDSGVGASTKILIDFSADCIDGATVNRTSSANQFVSRQTSTTGLCENYHQPLTNNNVQNGYLLLKTTPPPVKGNKKPTVTYSIACTEDHPTNSLSSCDVTNFNKLEEASTALDACSSMHGQLAGANVVQNLYDPTDLECDDPTSPIILDRNALGEETSHGAGRNYDNTRLDNGHWYHPRNLSDSLYDYERKSTHLQPLSRLNSRGKAASFPRYPLKGSANRPQTPCSQCKVKPCVICRHCNKTACITCRGIRAPCLEQAIVGAGHSYSNLIENNMRKQSISRSHDLLTQSSQSVVQMTPTPLERPLLDDGWFQTPDIPIGGITIQAKGVPTGGPTPRESFQPWACPFCTFDNHNNPRICEICFKTRDAPTELFKQVKHKVNKCPSCSLDNPESYVTCEMCHAALPVGISEGGI